MAGPARLGPGAVVRRVERLVAVAVPPARDRAAAGAGDVRDDRGGPYRLSRNPLYVGLLALYLGLALLAPTFWGSYCSRPRCCSSSGARSAPRSCSCTSGSVRSTTTTRGECVAGLDWTGGIGGWGGPPPRPRGTNEPAAAPRCPGGCAPPP